MPELIDRQAVLAEIGEFQIRFNETGDSHERVAYASAEHCMLVIKEAPAVNRWIPCSERLPEKDTDVIVCCYGSDMILAHDGETIQDAVERTCRDCVSVTVGFIGSDGWYGADWFPMMVAPTYWMPMPEPPKVDKQ